MATALFSKIKLVSCVPWMLSKRAVALFLSNALSTTVRVKELQVVHILRKRPIDL